MNEWLRAIAAGSQLSDEAARHLRDDGFFVVPGPVPDGELDRLAGAYDRGSAAADPADRCEGSTTIRIHDFVNRGAEFDPLYVHPPLLEACCQTLGQSFKLSSILGRTLLPGKPAQELHMDYPRDALGWTMIGFIFMIDEFRQDNGATCFVPKSHRQATIRATDNELVPACGTAGSMIIFNGSVWHGHGPNTTGNPRRSLQGAFIRRDEKPATNFASRMKPETHDRISPLARYLVSSDETIL